MKKDTLIPCSATISLDVDLFTLDIIRDDTKEIIQTVPLTIDTAKGLADFINKELSAMRIEKKPLTPPIDFKD